MDPDRWRTESDKVRLWHHQRCGRTSSKTKEQPGQRERPLYRNGNRRLRRKYPGTITERIIILAVEQTNLKLAICDTSLNLANIKVHMTNIIQIRKDKCLGNVEPNGDDVFCILVSKSMCFIHFGEEGESVGC